MISKDVIARYRATIGIECHVQLKTKTKLFAAVGNDAREAAPNTLISHICLGMPGALPVLNEKAVELASQAAFALGTTPQHFSKFDRKHYFYPDLPNGYQITQFDQPIVLGGEVTITVDGKTKTIGVTRAHLEADAGKNTHPTGADYSLVDLNRVGTPLLEIVSEPDMHTAAEARAYAHELYLLMKYADVSDCNLYYGNMRFDVNVSVSKTNALGTRTETKNLNSFKSVEKAVEYEISRQIELLEAGGTINQETRGWDDAKQKTISQRSKEEAHDYRYFPDPDLPPVLLDDAYIERVKTAMPVMPGVWRQRLQNLGLDQQQIDVLLETEIDDSDISYLSLIENAATDVAKSKQLSNWLVNIEIPLRRDEAVSVVLKDMDRARLYSEVASLVAEDRLSSTSAKSLITELLQHEHLPEQLEKYADEQGYIQVTDSNEIQLIVKRVLDNNPQAVEDIQKGEMKVLGFLVGQIMKESLGKANPKLAQELIRKELGL